MENQNLRGGIYITTKDIMNLNNCSIRQAQRELLAIKDILQNTTGKITVRAYCEYWKIDYEEVVKHINQYR